MPLGGHRSIHSLKSSRRKSASLRSLPSASTEDAEKEAAGDGSENVPCQGSAASSRGIDGGSQIKVDGEGEGGREAGGEGEEPSARARKGSAGQRAAGRAVAAEKQGAKHGRFSRNSKRASPAEGLSDGKGRCRRKLSPEPCAGGTTSEDECSSNGGSPVPIVGDEDMSEGESGQSLPGFEYTSPHAMNCMPPNWNVPREPIPDLLNRHCRREPPLKKQQERLREHSAKLAEEKAVVADLKRKKNKELKKKKKQKCM